MTDATQRPLKIPQKYVDYLDRHHVHHLIERMYEEVLTAMPSDPLACLVDFLRRENRNSEVPRILINSYDQNEAMNLAMDLNIQTDAMVLSRHETVYGVTESHADLKERLQDSGGNVTPKLLAEIVARRVKQDDCLRDGWILTGVPQCRDEMLQLQMAGVLPSHVVFISEAAVKRPEPARFQLPRGADAEAKQFARRVRGMLADCGPLARVFYRGEGLRNQVLQFVHSRGRENAPLVLRVLLLGVPGSGRRTQAARIAAKHSLINVRCGDLVRAAIRAGTAEGLAITDFLASNMTPPEELILSLVRQRLSEDDCRSQGWVLHGFPRDSAQAEHLSESDVFPNRVIYLNVPEEVAVARLTSRRYEPASGLVVTLTEDLHLPVEVRHRLRRHPDDDPRRVGVTVARRQAELQGALALLEQDVQEVDGTMTQLEIAEVVEKITVDKPPKFPE
ncbi:Adenylate kinase 8 [Amphibalanus amphitrite]|uniref:Adenylate kinase 8 n=1 Tax=Amphibalanus amphitrite TaxID=1232801 RepID=A0A6A4X2Q2_AMPAM|nr:Adenylate kinase 8 [Amphibalanus amphitrite]